MGRLFIFIPMNLTEEIGGTDIYLLDQILKGRFTPSMTILDAGCGSGRNMRWLAKQGAKICGCDLSTEALEMALQNTGLWESDFKIADLDKLPYENDSFDVIICSAVLHFARSKQHFMAMVSELHRTLKPGGYLFVRMTSSFGLPQNYISQGNDNYLLADGSTRFLLTEELFNQMKELGFRQVEPVKSTLVENLRSMTTLVLEKQ